MAIELKTGIANGVETIVLYYIGGDEHEVQQSLEAHLALGFELDGREYVDALGTKHRILTRSSDEPDTVIEDEEPEEIDATKAALALAAEEGLDLSLVEGFGSGGRIGVGDVRDFLEALEDEESRLPIDAGFHDDPETVAVNEANDGEEEIPSSEDEEPEEEIAGTVEELDADELGEGESLSDLEYPDDTEDLAPLPFEEEDEDLLPVEEVEGSIEELEEGE